MADDGGDVIVDEDATNAVAESYVWKYFSNISHIFANKVVPTSLCAFSVTENLPECPAHELLLTFLGVKLWAKPKLQ